MKLSIVVPTHQRNQSVLELCKCVANQQFPVDDFEIIIVTNLADSFFTSSIFLEKSKSLNMRVLTSGQQGVNRARNRGLEAAQADVCLLLDDDCYPVESGYFQSIYDYHCNLPQVLAIGGGYIVESKSSPVTRAYNLISRQWQHLSVFGDNRSSRLVGGNVSYKRLALKETGEVFNEDISFGGTESEFHHRLVRKGHELCYFPNLKVLHKNDIEVEQLISRAYKQAMTSHHFEIDSGSFKPGHGYHSQQYVWAKQETKSLTEFQQVLAYLRLYDWVYQYCLCHKEAGEQEVFNSSLRQLSVYRNSLAPLEAH